MAKTSNSSSGGFGSMENNGKPFGPAPKKSAPVTKATLKKPAKKVSPTKKFNPAVFKRAQKSVFGM